MEQREAFMGRVFTLQEARDLMPKVQDLTRPVFGLASSLADELQQADEREDEERAEELRERLQTLVESWAEAIRDLGPDPEITRFKGLGEISPDEFAHFIGPDMRLEQVTLHKNDQVQKLLEYYMGKNTMERQNFIIDNLVVEEDVPD